MTATAFFQRGAKNEEDNPLCRTSVSLSHGKQCRRNMLPHSPLNQNGDAAGVKEWTATAKTSPIVRKHSLTDDCQVCECDAWVCCHYSCVTKQVQEVHSSLDRFFASPTVPQCQSYYIRNSTQRTNREEGLNEGKGIRLTWVMLPLKHP